MREKRYIEHLVLTLTLVLFCFADSAAQTVRPPELNLQYHRAEAAWKRGGSLLEAKARVDRVLNELPEDVEALKLRSQVLLSLQKYDEALEDAQRAVKLDATDGEAQLVLAEAARHLDHREIAIRALEAASDHLLSDARAHVRMSWLAMELGLPNRAEAFGRIAIALDASEPAAYQQLARVFMLQGKIDEGAEILLRGLTGSVLNRTAIQMDSVLSPLLDHATLEGAGR